MFDIERTNKLWLTRIKNYDKYFDRIKIKLDWLHNLISSLIPFLNHSSKVSDNTNVS